MKKIKNIIAILVCLILVSAGSAWAQSFTATVNRNQIPEGETFLLTLSLSGAKTNSSPDLSVLNQDFTTYSVSNALQTNIINGKVDQSQQWNLVLMPNKTGSLSIPSIKLDNYATQPITLEVRPAGSEINTPSAGGTQPGKFAIAGKINNKNPYVQEQIIYTLKLTDRGGLQGEAPYFESEDDGAWIIKSLGAPEIHSQIVNGQTIRELIFKYALFPQKSGKLQVPAAKFRGFYLTKETRNDPFGRFFNDDIFLGGFGMTDVFATKNPIFLSTKPIDIDVKPAAETAGDWWLPAQDVRLHAQFDAGKPEFKVGEAVTRTVYLQATGVIDSQLPEVDFPQAAGLKQYPEKPEFSMKVQNGQVIATEKIANVYIPGESGELTLPAVSVPWFNVKTNQPEIARIPEQKIIVGGSAAPALPPAAAPAPTVSAENSQTAGPLTQSRIYALLAAAFVFGLVFCFLLMRFFAGRKPHAAAVSSINPQKDIPAAARAKDLRRLRDALLLWAQDRYPDERIFSLSDVERLVHTQIFSCELEKIDEALYSKSDAEWNPDLFLKAFYTVNRMKIRRKKEDAPLPGLYK